MAFGQRSDDPSFELVPLDRMSVCLTNLDGAREKEHVDLATLLTFFSSNVLVTILSALFQCLLTAGYMLGISAQTSGHRVRI
jgi:hypothetical protein